MDRYECSVENVDTQQYVESILGKPRFKWEYLIPGFGLKLLAEDMWSYDNLYKEVTSAKSAIKKLRKGEELTIEEDLARRHYIWENFDGWIGSRKWQTM